MTTKPRPTIVPQRPASAITVSHQPCGSFEEVGLEADRDELIQGFGLRNGSAGHRAPVWAGTEDLVRDDHRAFGIDDLAYRGNDALVADLCEVDDEIDSVRDEQVRRLKGQTLGGLDRVRRELRERALRGGRVERRHRAVIALAHCVQERENLLAACLANDHPVWRHAKRPTDKLGEAHSALALEVRLASLQRDDVGV
jgi:hypothetical protein